MSTFFCILLSNTVSFWSASSKGVCSFTIVHKREVQSSTSLPDPHFACMISAWRWKSKTFSIVRILMITRVSNTPVGSVCSIFCDSSVLPIQYNTQSKIHALHWYYYFSDATLIFRVGIPSICLFIVNLNQWGLSPVVHQSLVIIAIFFRCYYKWWHIKLVLPSFTMIRFVDKAAACTY